MSNEEETEEIINVNASDESGFPIMDEETEFKLTYDPSKDVESYIKKLSEAIEPVGK